MLIHQKHFGNIFFWGSRAARHVLASFGTFITAQETLWYALNKNSISHRILSHSVYTIKNVIAVFGDRKYSIYYGFPWISEIPYLRKWGLFSALKIVWFALWHRMHSIGNFIKHHVMTAAFNKTSRQWFLHTAVGWTSFKRRKGNTFSLWKTSAGVSISHWANNNMIYVWRRPGDH